MRFKQGAGKSAIAKAKLAAHSKIKKESKLTEDNPSAKATKNPKLEKKPKLSLYQKINGFFKMSEIRQFQIKTFQLIFFNYFLTLLVAIEEEKFDYPVKVSALEKILGHNIVTPIILSKYGFVFRLITVAVNTLAFAVIFFPKREFRLYLMPTILWSVFTIATTTENILEVGLRMHILELPHFYFLQVCIVGSVAIALLTWLVLQMLQFFDHLNYTTS